MMEFKDIVINAVAKNSIYVTESGCLLWLGRWKPYGTMSVKGKQISAHRAVWTAHYGKIPDGMLVCHHCDVPPCIRIDHLFIGTALDNSVDSINKNRSFNERHRSIISAANKGKHVSQYTRRLLSVRMKGVKNFLGKKHTDKTKLKMREAALLREKIKRDIRETHVQY